MLPAQPDAATAWRAVADRLRGLVGDSAFDIWLAPIQAVSYTKCALVLEGPPDTAGWVSDRFGSVLDRTAKDVLGPDTTVALRPAAAPGAPPGRSSAATADRPRRGGAPAGVTPDAYLLTELNPRYRFEQFVIGVGNHLAHAAALQVAELPGQAINPLFLHAPPGLGKTHLLHAIGHYVADYGGGAVVRYTTAEAFTNHFLSALQTRSIDAFKHAYRTADVLLIDDVQFLASKARTEEEFFHTFNALYETGRQLVLTCDRLPRALTDVEQRLRERFEAGLVANLEPPDQATRVAILRKRAALDEISVDDPAVLDLIAERVTDNIRVLEGALIRVVAYHSLTGRPIDPALTAEALDAMYPARSAPGTATRRVPSIAEVQQAVAAHFGLTVAQLTSASRAGTVLWPRQLAIHLARDLTDASLPAIGRAFGGRNHTTVLHACRRATKRLADDQQACRLAADLVTELSTPTDDRKC